jgi:hypothetical protein
MARFIRPDIRCIPCCKLHECGTVPVLNIEVLVPVCIRAGTGMYPCWYRYVSVLVFSVSDTHRLYAASIVNPNPRESEYCGWIRIRRKLGFGFGSRHCCKIKKLRKIADKDLKEKSFSVGNFFLCRTDFRTHIEATRGTIFKKNSG